MTTETNVPQEEQQQPEKPKKKIVKLKNVYVSNFKAIDELSAEINGNHFIVTGKNGRGKTSFAQAIGRNAKRLDPKDIYVLL